MVGEGRAEGMEKETQRYYHRDILQIILFFSTAPVSYRNQMKKWKNEVYFWSLLVTL